jgi:uncharacterized membrane protein YagU involved in acid resistance
LILPVPGILVDKLMIREISPFEKIIRGAAAGLLATVPMTAFMRAAWRILPRREQYPLPPRLITRKLVSEVEPPQRMDADDLTTLTYLLHFWFGAMTGALYGLIEDKVRLKPSAKGIFMGLAVWTGSYLGWIPLLGILPPATKHPVRRNLLMIAAHVVWGLALGRLTRRMNPRRQYIDL